MFKKGEYVIYGSSGVCKVEDITTMQMKDVPDDRLYYVLVPSGETGGKIFTPVDNQKTPMRRVMNREEATTLLEEIPQIEALGISSEKAREETYRECMKSCDCRDWVRIIKTLYKRRIQRGAQGKKITATDEKYLRMAEHYLCSELQIPMEVPMEKMEQYVSEQISLSISDDDSED